MTPQEKAKELIDSMYNTPHCGIEHFPSKHYCDCSEMNLFQAKQCALVAVSECLRSAFFSTDEIYNFYLEVKQEIEKL
jgi:predicted DNA-binding ArsR family transcriptional regulator